MGKRGPMPKPADQILGHRKRKAVATRAPRRVVPVPPPDLLPETLEAWRVYWTSELSTLALGVDGPSTRRLFGMYDQHARAMAIVNVALMVKGSTGQLRTNPLAEHALKLEAAILRLENELGLTPMARVRLGIKLGTDDAAAKPAQPPANRYGHLRVVNE